MHKPDTGKQFTTSERSRCQAKQRCCHNVYKYQFVLCIPAKNPDAMGVVLMSDHYHPGGPHEPWLRNPAVPLTIHIFHTRDDKRIPGKILPGQ